MNKLTKILLCLFCIALLCSISFAYPEPGAGNGKSKKIVQVHTGELTEKHESNGHYYVLLQNDDEDMSYSVHITKNKYRSAKIGEYYEWKRIIYPGGKESVSFHRI